MNCTILSKAEGLRGREKLPHIQGRIVVCWPGGVQGARAALHHYELSTKAELFQLLTLIRYSPGARAAGIEVVYERVSMTCPVPHTPLGRVPEIKPSRSYGDPRFSTSDCLASSLTSLGDLEPIKGGAVSCCARARAFGHVNHNGTLSVRPLTRANGKSHAL